MSDSGGVPNPSGSGMGWASSPHAANFVPGVAIPRIEILAADRKGCPVCGHPTGDCVGSHPGIESSITFVNRGVDPEATFSVPHRVFEASLVGKRRVRRLLYAPGDRIRPDEARRLGLMPSRQVSGGLHD